MACRWQREDDGRVGIRILACLPWGDSFASESRGGKKDKPGSGKVIT